MSTAIEGPRVSWFAPHLAHTTRRRWPGQVLVLAGLAGASLLDALLMRPALLSVVRDSEQATSVIAVGLSALAAVAAAWVGHTWRGARGWTPDRDAALLPPALVGLLWLGLGLGIAWLRITAGRATAAAAYQDAGSTSSGPTFGTMVAATLFLVLYLLVGAVAAGDFYHLRQDAYQAKVSAERQAGAVRTELVQDEALLRRLVENYEIRLTDLQWAQHRTRHAQAMNLRLADHLKQLARLEQAIGLAGPPTTGITSAAHPDNPTQAMT